MEVLADAETFQNENEVWRKKGNVLLNNSKNASWRVPAKISLRWCFCGFLFIKDFKNQSQKEGSADIEAFQDKNEVTRDKGKVLLSESKTASWWVSAENSLKWCFCGFLFN